MASLHEQGSRIHWQAVITQLEGLLRTVPSWLIRGAAQKEIEDIWRTVADKLLASPTPRGSLVSSPHFPRTLREQKHRLMSR